jgi:hypothetical protein
MATFVLFLTIGLKHRSLQVVGFEGSFWFKAFLISFIWIKILAHLPAIPLYPDD